MNTPRTRIILAEDDPSQQALLVHAITRNRPHVLVEAAGDRESFEQAIARKPFDCAILDFYLSEDYTANEMLQRLKIAQPTCPALVVSASDDQYVAISSFRRGSVDFLHKNDALKGETLWRKIMQAISTRRQAVRDRRRRARRVHDLEQMAVTDPLTGLSNRYVINRMLQRPRRRLLDRRESISIFMIDLDHFKKLNDIRGHTEGDRVLNEVGRLIQEMQLENDVSCRWGGEEFLLVRTGTSLAQSLSWAEDLRNQIARIDEGNVIGKTELTASIGVFHGTAESFSEDTIARADEALYLAKELGRNRVRTWRMVGFYNLARTLECAQRAPEDRLRQLLKRSTKLLGPTQRKDLSTHSARVANMSVRIAAMLGLPVDEIQQLKTAGRFHDLGKYVIPEAVLGKVQPLTGAEYQLIGRHAEEGAEMAAALGVPHLTTEMIRLHHVRFDEISRSVPPPVPLGARILCASDALVAMTSDRPYQAARSKSSAAREMHRERGRQFDPEVVDAACRCMLPYERLTKLLAKSIRSAGKEEVNQDTNPIDILTSVRRSKSTRTN